MHVHAAQDMEQTHPRCTGAGTWQDLADRVEEAGEWCCPYPRSNFLDEMPAKPLETKVSSEPKSLPWTGARATQHHLGFEQIYIPLLVLNRAPRITTVLWPKPDISYFTAF